MIRLDYIVTGTGRCGTLFAANFLTSAGIPCTHEAIFTKKGIEHVSDVLNGIVLPISSKVSRGDNLSDYEMDILADASYMSAPFLHEFQSAVIHMIRNPIKVVSSFMGLGYFSRPQPTSFLHEPDQDKYEAFIYSHLPELTGDMPQLDRACLYWTAWNEMIESSGRVAFKQKIEDSKEGLSSFIGRKGTYSNERCNFLNKRRLNWSVSQISSPSIRKRFKNIAKKYGYIKEL